MYTLEIVHDDQPCDPREDCAAATMAFFHTRYILGDKGHGINHDDYGSWGEMGEDIVKKGARAILPVYMLDHSGLTISTNDFRDPWDSGQIGFIYMNAEQIRETFMVKRITKPVLERAYDLLRGEVADYDAYLSGDCWGYTISREDEPDEVVESCWGFLGYEYCREAGESELSAWNEGIR